MTLTKHLRAGLALAFTSLLLGCGGSGLLGPGATGGSKSSQDQPQAASSYVPQPDIASLDWTPRPSRRAQELELLPGLAGSLAAPVELAAAPARQAAAAAAMLGGLLPALPQDGPARTASAAYTDTASLIAPALKSDNVLLAADKLTLSSSSKLSAWAVYGFPTWATKASQSATVSGSVPIKVNGFKSGVYIALANYSAAKWQFFPSVYNLSAPATVSFKPGADYISPGGNVYILVASWNGDVVEITSITTAGDDSNVPPLAALSVSSDLGYSGFATTLDASASSDSDLSIVKYEFDLGQGAGYQDNGANPVLNTNIAGVGGRLVSVRVTDEGGLSSTAQAVVLAVAPGSFLPLSWYRARMNAGLGLASMGYADLFGGGRVFPDFFFEGLSSHSGYVDMRTKLPIWFDGWIGDPEGLPTAANELRFWLESQATLQELLLKGNSYYWDQHQITAQNFNPALDPAQPLAAALAAFVSGAGGTPNQANYQAAIGSMPLNQQQALARVVLAAESARARRAAVFSQLGFTPEIAEVLFAQGHGDPLGGLISLDTGQYIPALFDVTSGNYLLAGLPYADAFYIGAAEICSALDQLRAFVTANNPVWPNVNLSIDTPAGRIVIAGTGNDTHAAVLPDGHALLIDLGGSDTYNCHAGANASSLNPVSLCIDLGNGNDIYNALDDPFNVDRTQNPSDDNSSQQGAGRLGIGMLLDFGGNDEYYSVRLSQGSAVFGVGILADLDGNDKYEFEALGQGGAFAGIGILYDASGDDSYDAWHKAQGWGGLMGIGMLVDKSNSEDSYLAQAALDPQRPEYSGWFGLGDVDINLSLAQGAANGLPINAITVGGTKIAGGGGLGLLADFGANDTYSAGAFAQAAGHYQSTGLLLDLAGGDSYNAYSYAQGAAANSALACLYELQGSDSYFVDAGPGIGAGDGIALAWLLDLAGSETYDAPAVALGTGRNNGMGYLVDWTGADQYLPHAAGFAETTLGRALLGTGNAALRCYGLFVDDAGNDNYALGYANMAAISFGSPPANGGFWVRIIDGGYNNGRGSGIDN